MNNLDSRTSQVFEVTDTTGVPWPNQDHKGRSVVISGDMSPNENLIKYGSGADVVIHEVAVARPELLQKSDVVCRIVANHCTPEEAGKNFARIKPKLAVYTHFALFSGEGSTEVTIPEIIARTRTTYSGPLEAGEDLMPVLIGDKVSVEHNNQMASKPCP